MAKLIRITTIPGSLRGMLNNQLKYMSRFYEVIAVSSPGEMLEEVGETQGVRTCGILMTRSISLAKDALALSKLIRFLRKERPQIVHSHTPKAGLLGMLAARIVNIPVRMHTVAGLPLMESSGIKKFVLIQMEKLTYACATHVYPNSYGLRDYMLETKLIKASKIKILGKGSSNGVDLSHFDPDKITNDDVVKSVPEFETKLRGRFNYVFVGRIVKDKGINELVKAFVKLAKEKPASNLILLGDYEKSLSPILPETEQYIREHENIFFFGYQRDIRPFLKISNVMVFPSYREGLPNAVLQAGAFSIPVICTNIPGCTDIIQHGFNGLLVDPKDAQALYLAMLQVQDNILLLDEMKSRARSVIKDKYDRSQVFASIHEEYENNLNNIK